MPVLLARLLTLSAAGWSVAGSGNCPDPEAVRARLAALMPANPELRARVDAEPDGVRVELLDVTGRVLFDRLLPRRDSCDTLAQACAVVLAAAALPFAAVEHRFELPPPAAPSIVRAPPPEESSNRRWALDLSAAVTGGLAGSLAPGARLEASMGRRSDGWLGQLALTAETARSLSLGPGSVGWQRFSAALGAARRWRVRAVHLEVAGRLLGSALLLEGHGYSTDQTAWRFDPGLELLVRALLGRGAWRPWLGVAAAGWLPTDDAMVAGIGGAAAIPQLEGLALLGLDIQLGNRE
ncbi:MAG TPA: hypothetical protein VMB50_03985 [Myxococcales bacterium]|nr:hypothetical protein [Myxococcales bacterium]